MKLLKIKIKGLPHFKGILDVDFLAQQRVDSDDKDNLYNVFSNMYINQVVSFIGINAAGKTTVLKALSFAIELLNNEPINKIKAKDLLEGLLAGEEAIFEIYFADEKDVHKLETVIKKEDSIIENNGRYVITKEKIWIKSIEQVKTKKGIFDFDNVTRIVEREDDDYLMDDVSIMVAMNKKYTKKIFLRDMSNITDVNWLTLMGEYPKELIAFFDPNIEYLKFNLEGNKNVDIRLKFKSSEEIVMNHPTELNKYLSSGTIKGMSVFMNAIFAFKAGGCIIVDELENHFNREIVATLIRFFMDKNINKTGAILMFSTHYAELLDEFNRNDCIYIVRNRGGIAAENLANILKRNDIKKSEAYQSDFLDGTVPSYETYMALKKVLVNIQ